MSSNNRKNSKSPILKVVVIKIFKLRAIFIIKKNKINKIFNN